MATFSEGIEIRAFRRGREEGREEGAAETMLTNIRNMIETLHLTPEAAMNALKVPYAEQEKLLPLI